MREISRRSPPRLEPKTISPGRVVDGVRAKSGNGIELWQQARKLLVAAGYKINAKRRLPNNFGWQLRLATGQVVSVYDSGAVVVQGIGAGPVERLLQRLVAPNTLVRVTERTKQLADLGLDADGYPIPLPGTDVVLAMGPPEPPPKIWDNPKTLRHMCNRLRSLGYVVKSTKWDWWESAWQINLATGQTLSYQESGRVRLGPFQRDPQLERLFNIPGPPDQVAYPLSSPVGVSSANRKGRKL